MLTFCKVICWHRTDSKHSVHNAYENLRIKFGGYTYITNPLFGFKINLGFAWPKVTQGFNLEEWASSQGAFLNCGQWNTRNSLTTLRVLTDQTFWKGFEDATNAKLRQELLQTTQTNQRRRINELIHKTTSLQCLLFFTLF